MIIIIPKYFFNTFEIYIKTYKKSILSFKFIKIIFNYCPNIYCWVCCIDDSCTLSPGFVCSKSEFCWKVLNSHFEKVLTPFLTRVSEKDKQIGFLFHWNFFSLEDLSMKKFPWWAGERWPDHAAQLLRKRKLSNLSPYFRYQGPELSIENFLRKMKNIVA